MNKISKHYLVLFWLPFSLFAMENKNINSIEKSPVESLYAAIKDPKVISVQELINQRNIDLNVQGLENVSPYPPLYAALIYDKPIIAEELIFAGVDVNLQAAVEVSKGEIAKPALGWAVKKNHKGVVEKIINHSNFDKSQLNKQYGSRKETLVHIAVENLDHQQFIDNAITIIDLLTKAGADCSIWNIDKNTPKDIFDKICQTKFENSPKLKAHVNKALDYPFFALFRSVMCAYKWEILSSLAFIGGLSCFLWNRYR